MTEMFSLRSFKQDVCYHSSLFGNAYLEDLQLPKRPSKLLALGFRADGVLTPSPSRPAGCWEKPESPPPPAHTHTHAHAREHACTPLVGAGTFCTSGYHDGKWRREGKEFNAGALFLRLLFYFRCRSRVKPWHLGAVKLP